MRVYKRHHVVTVWILALACSVAWGAGDHSDIERRVKQTLQSLPGSLPPSKIDPMAANQCLCGPAIAGPNAAPTSRALTLNDIPPGSPPGPHGITHEYGGIDQLSVNAPQSQNRVYIGPTSGAAAQPTFRVLTEADLPNAAQNYALAGPTSGGAGAPTYRPLVPADLTQAPANQFLAGPSSGGTGTPVYRALVAADVSSVAAPATNIDPLNILPGTISQTEFGYLDGLGASLVSLLTGKLDTTSTKLPPTPSGAGKTIYDNGSAYVALNAGTTSQVHIGGTAPSWGPVPLAALPAHVSTHLPGGSDALTTAVPVQVGTANSAGSAASLARSDHVHQSLSYYTVTFGATTVNTSSCNAAAIGGGCSSIIGYKIIIIPRAGILTNQYCVLAGTQPTGGNTILSKIFKNGSGSFNTCTIATDTSICNTSSSLAVAAGDYLAATFNSSSALVTNAYAHCTIEIQN